MRLEKGQKRVIPKLSSEGHFYFFGYRNRSLKGSRKNNFPPLSVDPSRLAALLVLYIPRVCAVLAPCQTGVSTPKNKKVFLREP